MASILGKPGGPGQFPTHDLSTVRGALQYLTVYTAGKRYLAASLIINSRCTLVTTSVRAMSPEFGSRAATSMARSIPAASCTPARVSCTRKDDAAASIARKNTGAGGFPGS